MFSSIFFNTNAISDIQVTIGISYTLNNYLRGKEEQITEHPNLLYTTYSQYLYNMHVRLLCTFCGHL